MTKLLSACSCILLLTFAFPSKILGQYADLGTGNLKNQIWWFDWAGFTIANGSSKTFTTATGLVVTVTFSGVSGPVLSPTIMNTWSGSVLHLLYNFSNSSIKPAFYNLPNTASDQNFTLTITGTKDGVPVPVTFVAADAEASAPNEVTTLVTNGSNWNTIDFFRNSSQTANPLTGCNTQTVKLSTTYGNLPQTGQNPVLSSRSNSATPLVVQIKLEHGGVSGMGVAFGVLEAIDRGDLPASYGFAQHLIGYNYNNSCNFLPPLPSIEPIGNLKLGNNAGDADGSQSLDDNLQGADEDAITAFPTYSGLGLYSLTLPLINTTGTPAYLTGWFDYNNNGSFEATEAASITIPNNATSGTITWTGLPTSFPLLVKHGFRFRLSSNHTNASSPVGYALDGEVEDYIVIIPQTALTSFASADTVCVNAPVTLNNTSVGASAYNWNFCVANSITNPLGTNLGNFGFTLPVFMDYAKEGNNYYGFVTNNSPGKLIRLNFGNSLLNAPIATDFGNLGGVIPDECEGIQLVNQNGRWYVIAVGGKTTGRIVKVDFGTSLSNNLPIATNWGNIGGLADPTDLHLFQDGDTWYGLTINALTNSITRFNFSSSFTSIPTGTNLGNIGGLSYPTGIYAVSNNGTWHAFVSNAVSAGSNESASSISRLDFGTSLLNTPTGVNLGNPGGTLRSARDITIYKSCNEVFGFVVNYSTANDIVRLNFQNSLTTVPLAASIGNTGSLNFPHSISKLFRDGNDLYSFVTNADGNTLTRLKFEGCNNASIANSPLQNPSTVSYDAPGTYSITLTTDEGLPTQNSFCKTITVVPNPPPTATKFYQICAGSSIKIGSATKAGTYVWNTGATTDSIIVNAAGVYWVESSKYGCTSRESFEVTILINPPMDFSFQTDTCDPKKIEFLTYLAPTATFQWAFGNGQTNSTSLSPSIIYSSPGVYNVSLNTTYQNGCKDSLKKQVAVSSLFDSSLIINRDTTICLGDSVLVKTSSKAISQCWASQNGTTLQTLTGYVKPSISTTYTLTSEIAGDNLIVNSDFSTGNQDFLSSYQYTNVNTSNDQYWVGSNPASWNSTYGACVDHSSGTGNMLMISPSTEPKKTIWSQSVNVLPNTNYRFSGWFQALAGASSSLEFSINGVRIGKEIVSTSNSCEWKQFSALWNAGTNTNVLLSIETNTPGNIVHATAIDDLFFGTITTGHDSLRIQVGDVCDSISISGEQKVCSPSDTISYSIYKPADCATRYVLQYDPTSVKVISSTDSSFSAVFLKNGQTWLKVLISNTCQMVADSIDVTVKFSPTEIILGPNLSVCRDTSFVLNFGGGFATYVWQDGSTDSTFDVTTLGLYHVQASNFCNEIFSDSIRISRKIITPFAFNPKTIEACLGDSVQLQANGGDLYNWTPINKFSNPNSAITNAIVDNISDFTLRISDTVCLRDTLITIPTIAHALPNISIFKSNDVNCGNDSAVLSAVGGLRYSWSPNLFITRTSNAAIIIKPPHTVSYKLTGEDANGCKSQDSVVVNFSKEGEQKLYVPSAFTPNNDGKNDFFKPVFIGPVSKYDFRIYNRWGQLLFRTNSVSGGWDGKYGTTLQPGDVFVYYIRAEGGCSGLFERKGTFVLIR